MAPREKIFGIISGVFRQFGYLPLGTPALEYTEILMGKYGAEGEKLLYRFEDNGGRDVSLRYDLTVPLARVVAQHTQLPRPFRRYQIAPVWRAEKPARGRFREFFQCDVDVIGSDSLLADFECIEVGVAVLRALGVEDFQIRLNDRRILDGLLAKAGVSGRKTTQTVLRAVDKLPKIGWPGVQAELEAIEELSSAGIDVLHGFLEAELSQLTADIVDMEVAGPGIESLEQLLQWVDTQGIGQWVGVDLSIARGLDYYTATIYETFLGAMPELGSVMSGGRYDNLLSMFSKDTIPAVGISLGVDRLLAGLIELGILERGTHGIDVYVTVFDEASVAYSQGVAGQLRAAGISVQLHLTPGQKLARQFKSAARSGASFVVVAGPDECAAERITIKDMTTGAQQDVSLSDGVDWIRQQIQTA